MRRRIRKMVDDRTRMLTAVSHDLRTPLTRLRMRVERSKEIPSKQSMLDDIATLTAMIEDSLQYLSSTARDEPLRKVDIAALLKTVVAGFCDLGHTVIYVGPERFGYTCKQKGLTRAVTNIVENAVRFGTIVDVQLSNYPPSEVVIVVRDNGPGLAHGLHEKALEPFFKADEARTSKSDSGFGLGLSIADEIVKGHGGCELRSCCRQHRLFQAGARRPLRQALWPADLVRRYPVQAWRSAALVSSRGLGLRSPVPLRYLRLSFADSAASLLADLSNASDRRRRKCAA
jgi:K+-sensing histidine kinase KdpD